MRRLLATLTAFFALAAPAQAAWTWPVSGDVITPYRNGTDPYASGQHRGIDIAAPVGAAVRAAAAGEVMFAGTAGSSGLTISIRTGDGYDTSYLHLSSLAVRAGAHVASGDRIGAVGTTGSRSAVAPHLHFGVRDAGTRHAYHDPLRFLGAPALPQGTPDPPAPAPAGQPVSAPPTPAPMPAPVPAAGRGPATTPAPRLAPVRRPAPLLEAGRRALPRPSLHGTPRPASNAPIPAAPHGPPRAAPRKLRAPRPEGAPRTLLNARSRMVSVGRPTPSNAAHPPDRPRSEPGSPTQAPARTQHDTASTGPNIGWALACAGLLLAAGILGLADNGHRSKRRRDRLPLALRPLFLRR